MVTAEELLWQGLGLEREELRRGCCWPVCHMNPAPAFPRMRQCYERNVGARNSDSHSVGNSSGIYVPPVAAERQVCEIPARAVHGRSNKLTESIWLSSIELGEETPAWLQVE